MQNMKAQQIIALYEGNIPNSKPYKTKEKWEPQDNGDTIVRLISQPTLSIFLPEKDKATGVRVIDTNTKETIEYYAKAAAFNSYKRKRDL